MATKKQPKKSKRAARKRSTRAVKAQPLAYEGSQAMIPGVEPRKKDPHQDGDDQITVQTLRVTRREVRRWSEAANNGREPWAKVPPMVWARKLLNDAAAKALGSVL